MVQLLGDDFGDNPSDCSLGRDRGPETVNGVLRDRCGAFPGPVTFDQVGALLTERGVPLAEVPCPADPDEMRTYWQPDSTTMVYVVSGSSYGNAGDVCKVISPDTP
ncbi:hypothetical protein QRX60_27965 [Amycolatopsis mongoliensis]|uniref:Uncharacterized protein n=1 Tax=Amycolatopsis mongoliensis TaxID=715475 RepID=A0A9Y2NAZ4_9PSEU|nr:hypothetical protein [Amycolatopsis sp. 4-36]WIX97916.1 hypothetical protein QRX60_27965 [Amycolatopsis sp. 4-36]